jgi:hypothetical protein
MFAQYTMAQKFVVYNKSGQTVEYQTADVDSIVFVEASTEPVNPNPYNHQYVDLGLPSGTKWAVCNLGAEDDDPEAVGDYFAWGETTPKETFTKENYKWWDLENDRMTKYALGDDLAPEDDAATVNWGPGWSTPTTEQWFEMLANAIDIDPTVASPHLGQDENTVMWKLTFPNGNSIKLVSQGYYHDGDMLSFEIDWTATLWSGSLSLTDGYGEITPASDPGIFIFGPLQFGFAMLSPFYGTNIHPVYTGE